MREVEGNDLASTQFHRQHYYPCAPAPPREQPSCPCDGRPADAVPGASLGRIAPCVCAPVPPCAGTGGNGRRRQALRRPPCRAVGRPRSPEGGPGRGVPGCLSHALPCAPCTYLPRPPARPACTARPSRAFGHPLGRGADRAPRAYPRHPSDRWAYRGGGVRLRPGGRCH